MASTAPAPAPAPASAAVPPPKRRFVGRSPASIASGGAASKASSSSIQPLNAIPTEILEDPLINASINALLPRNYSFEIHKTIHQIRKFNIKKVALQMPEGLAMFGTGISDLIEMHTDAEAVILADVTYGACCVDDYTARALGCDMLVHYGHSCLIPIDTTAIRCLYVFVEIGVDTSHLLQTVLLNFPSCLTPSLPSTSQSPEVKTGAPALSIDSDPDGINTIDKGKKRECHLAIVGTVQFLNAVHGLKADLEDPEKTKSSSLPNKQKTITSSEYTASVNEEDHEQTQIKWRVTIPQVKPLSPGEILGCTAPKLPKDIDGLLYIGDGRFHLESIMIANPNIPAYRYDPYSKKFTKEGYEHDEMLQLRGEAISTARKSLSSTNTSSSDSSSSSSSSSSSPSGNNWGVILGTLGRQGSLSVLKTITTSLPIINTIPILLSELSPAKLAILSPFIATFVQTSCPRLSIDWGYAFKKPLLSTYEASVALGKVSSRWSDSFISSEIKKGNNTKVSNKSRLAAIGAEKIGGSQEGKETKDRHDYPMDFYADMSLGPWTPRWHIGQKELERKRKKEERDRQKALSTGLSINQQGKQTSIPVSVV